MTSTLMGRWQTRLLLLGTVGLLITLTFAVGWVASAGNIYWLVLVWTAWDPGFRWDHDWPALFQLLAGIWEGFFIYLPLGWPLRNLQITHLDNFRPDLFLWHYSLVWLGVFTASQTVMRILFPRWRFRGGRWL
ncbi:MAG: hypothetical protein ACK4QL_03490 [Pseudanabaenaceae cyanobacterium]